MDTGAAAGHEIAGIFPSQLAAAAEILDRAASAAAVDILALRGSELIGLADPLRRAAGTAPPGQQVAVRVLLLDPGSAAARRRAGELGEPPGSFAAEITDTVAQMADLASELPRLRLELRLTWLGGTCILERVDRGRDRLLDVRPALGAGDVPRLLWRAALWNRSGR